MHALPGRHREGGEIDAAGALGCGAADRAFHRHARRLDLRPRPGGAQPASLRAQIFSRGPEQADGAVVMRQPRERFWNHDALKTPEAVGEAILMAARSVTPPPTPPHKGEGSTTAQAAKV